MARHGKRRLNPQSALSVTDQKRLAKLNERPDLVVAMRLRVRLLTRLEQDFEWFYSRLCAQVEFGHREFDPAAKMLVAIMDRILPAQRETMAHHSEPEAAMGPPVTIKILNVNRGTGAARTRAIAVQAEKRAVAETPP